jgi:hypothetical protein
MIHHISKHTFENAPEGYASDAFDVHDYICQWTCIAWYVNEGYPKRKYLEDVMERGYTTNVPRFDQGLLPETSP